MVAIDYEKKKNKIKHKRSRQCISKTDLESDKNLDRRNFWYSYWVKYGKYSVYYKCQWISIRDHRICDAIHKIVYPQPPILMVFQLILKDRIWSLHFSLLFNFALCTSIVGNLFDHLQQWIYYFVNSITNSMISNGYSLTFLPTNTFLVKIGIKNSDLCNFCKNASNSILHYIWLCPVVKLIWNRIKTWIEEIFDIPIELNMANIVFITKNKT
jgi:hypothetical protein